MEEEHLHLLINEEIYLLSQDDENGTAELPKVEEVVDDVDTSKESVETTEQVSVEESVEAPDTPKVEEEKKESPKIPVQQKVEEAKEIPFAVFHSSDNPSDIELLQKIIEACKVPQDQYEIFGGGFDQSIRFKKALVFVPEAKAFYTPIPYKKSEFLCSKPLSEISGDVQEKGKLWAALQKFVDSLQE